MKLNKIKINYLKSFFAQKKYIKKVYLYGSYSIGKANKNSDIDFFVIIDYIQINNNALDFLSISSELSKYLNSKVSIITENAFSRFIIDYSSGQNKLIYDSEYNVNIPDYLFNDFDTNEYRDKVKLEYINISLERITDLYQKNNSEKDILLSAKIQEFKTFTTLYSELTSATKEEIINRINNTALIEINQNYDFGILFKNLYNSYYEIDDKILDELIQSNLYDFRTGISSLLGEWNTYFKNRVCEYFVFIFANSINDSRKTDDFENNLDIFKNRVITTVNQKDIFELTHYQINEGSKNILLITNNINFKNIWGDIVEVVCPFFPLC